MRRVCIFGVLMIAMVGWPRDARAQATAGDREFLVFANVFSFISPDTTSTTGILFFNVGQFMTDRFELGGGPNITISSSGGAFGSGTSFDLGVNAFGRYYFGEQSATVKPYVGGEYQVTSLNPPEGASVADFQFLSGIGGVKSYLTEKTAIDFNASFGVRPNAAGDFQLLNFSVGLTHIF
jgi:hypothetical protein